MDKEQLQTYQEKLEKLKKDLLEQISEHEKMPDLGNDLEDEDEETDETEEAGNQMAVAEDLKKQLQEINGALLRIQKGEYGKCLNCGGEIPEDVLSAAPESELCRDCKVASQS